MRDLRRHERRSPACELFIGHGRLAGGKTSCVKLGREYGVDSTLILRIVQRKMWRHVV